jgi:hypothetical protein
VGKEAESVVRHWLSLWRGDALPSRADFSPRQIIDQLPRIAIFEIVPDLSIRCRLAGSDIVQGAGLDITGKDILAFTPPAERATRLTRFSTVARGAIGRGLRAGFRDSGEAQFAEEIMLPFGDVGADDTRQVLVHISWRQTAYNPTRTGIENNSGLSHEVRLTPLQAAVPIQAVA